MRERLILANLELTAKIGVRCHERLSSGAPILKKLNLIAIPLLISVAGIASAQDTHSLSIRAGFSYLANKDSRDATSNSGWTAGLSYDLQSKYLGGAGAGNNKVSIDLDWDSHNGQGNTIETGALQLAVRSAATTDTGGRHHRNAAYNSTPYFGAGIGAFRNRISGGGASDTKTNFGGSVLVGMNFSQNSYVELSYRISGSIDGVRCDTIDAVVGMHF